MIRAFQWDLARQVERFDWLLEQLPKYARWGYQELHLHLEDAVDFPSLPEVARRDAYSWLQFQQLVAAADAVGIKVVPIVNLLGHTQYLIKTTAWRDLNELRAPDGSPLSIGQICPSHPRTLEVAAKLIQDVAPYCTAGKIHLGLDESFLLGRHPASRAAIAASGLAGYFAGYVRELQNLAAGWKLRSAIWADMLVLLPDAIPHLPAGLIAYDWYYHAFQKLPRFELHNFQTYDLAGPLRAQGIAYWGCPMNGAFRHEPLPVFGERMANAQAWWQRCHTVGAEGFLVSAWEPNRLAIETTTLVDAAIAGLWLDPAPFDQVDLLKRGWERLHGRRDAPRRARQLLACDQRAFAGYARWELNQRWDTVHGRDGSRPYAADTRFFVRLLQQGTWPAAFDASLRWRLYLAQRDHFVREMAQTTLRARRILHRRRNQDLMRVARRALASIAQFEQLLLAGGQAEHRMWLASREARQPSPNRAILHRDQMQLKKLRRWWEGVRERPTRVQLVSPVAGRWMLRVLVHTTNPNLQAIVVQTYTDDGEWRDVHQRYLIEFRTAAARRSTNIRHWLSVPLARPDLAVRFALRGFGQFALSDVHLTDGIREFRAKTESRRTGSRITLGSSAPATDVFALDRQANQATWEPCWSAAPSET